MDVCIGREIELYFEVNTGHLCLLETLGRDVQEPTLPSHVDWLSVVIVGDSLYLELSTTTPIRLDVQLNLGDETPKSSV